MTPGFASVALGSMISPILVMNLARGMPATESTYRAGQSPDMNNIGAGATTDIGSVYRVNVSGASRDAEYGRDTGGW
jgi:hypothetical protein